MRTRLAVQTFVLCCSLASCALAGAQAWDTISYDKWGFALQIPAGCVKQEVLADDGCDVYAVGSLVCVVKVTPTPDKLPASTAIEQAIQAEVKDSSKLGTAKRWEQESKQGDLFKGFVAPIQLKADDPVGVVSIRIVGSDSAVQCVSMAPVGDDDSPILRISVIGPSDRQAEVVTTAKGIAAFAARTKPALQDAKLSATAAKKRSPDAGTPPKPKPAAKPWPELKKGEIELAGVVDSVSPDGKSLSMTVDLVTLPGGTSVTLSPARTKRVILKAKLTWLSTGQRIRMLGRNTGVGKPITADALEPCPESQPSSIGSLQFSVHS